MSNRIEKGLGELLTFISNVALAIRMNSAYNGQSAYNPKTPKAVMQLSDSIHNLHLLGNALVSGNYNDILHGIGLQISYWEQWKERIGEAAKENVDAPIFNIDEGIDILKRLQNEVETYGK